MKLNLATITRHTIGPDPVEGLRGLLRDAGGSGDDRQLLRLTIHMLEQARHNPMLVAGILTPTLGQIRAGLGDQIDVPDLTRRATTAIFGGTA